MAVFAKLGNYRDVGLLILRVVFGILLITHGYPKLMGGPEKWEQLGRSVAAFGIKFYPAFWGFMAAFAEGVGGLLIVLGLFFRPACLMVLITMIVATNVHLSKGDGVSGAEMALLYGSFALSMFIIGPGRYSVDKR